jgi:CDGSH-type Zn-finger protein
LRVTADANGCLFVEAGGRHLVQRAGRESVVEHLRIALCRCGHSGSKPYCDSTHAVAGFVAPRSELIVVEERERSGAVKITSTENGPNQVEIDTGAWRVDRDGGEETIERTTIFLCRCGHSENKPFCDGTHRKIGFVAPLVEIEVQASP